MAQHNVYTFFSVNNCLDAEFDAVDAAADHDLCQAIVAGRMGLHPEAWDARSALTAVMPQGFHGYEWVPEAYRRPIDRSAMSLRTRRENTEWEAKHQRRPVEEPEPRRQPTRPERRAMAADWHAPAHGEIQLTCDVCNRHRLGMTLEYRGNRAAKVAEIRAIGRQNGWTCIAGTDRCPACSRAVEPNPVGNGAGGDQGNEQHA